MFSAPSPAAVASNSTEPARPSLVTCSVPSSPIVPLNDATTSWLDENRPRAVPFQLSQPPNVPALSSAQAMASSPEPPWLRALPGLAQPQPQSFWLFEVPACALYVPMRAW